MGPLLNVGGSAFWSDKNNSLAVNDASYRRSETIDGRIDKPNDTIQYILTRILGQKHWRPMEMATLEIRARKTLYNGCYISIMMDGQTEGPKLSSYRCENASEKKYQIQPVVPP